MNKIFKLKEWLTLEETARRLTNSFGEKVSVSDCLQFALDGHITISALFEKSFYAIKTKQTIKTKRQIFGKGIRRETDDGAYINLLMGDEEYFFSNEELDTPYLDLDRIPPVVSVSHGIYDLPNPMIGAEEFDVMHVFDIKQHRKPRELVCMEGPFLQFGEYTLNKMNSFNELKFERVNGRGAVFMDQKTGKEVDFHNYHSFFYPDDRLGDVEFIFRRENVERFEQSTLNETDEKLTLNEGLLVIGSMLNALKSTQSTSKRWTQDTLKAEILENDKRVSSRLLDDYFSSANKTFKSKS